MDDNLLAVVKLREDSEVPNFGSPEAAGLDLASSEDCVVPSKGKRMIGTGLSVCIPNDCYGRIAARSGLAWRHSIKIGGALLTVTTEGKSKSSCSTMVIMMLRLRKENGLRNLFVRELSDR